MGGAASASRCLHAQLTQCACRLQHLMCFMLALSYCLALGCAPMSRPATSFRNSDLQQLLSPALPAARPLPSSCAP